MLMGPLFLVSASFCIVNRKRMLEMIDFFTQIKKVRNKVLYASGSPFMGKRYLSIVNRERMNDRLFHTKKVCNRVLYVNGSPFLGKR